MQHLTRSLCSSSITEPSTLVRIVSPHRYFRLMAATTCAFPFALERLVPAVPFESLRQIHAPSTPAAACPVIRYPADFSQKYHSPLILTALLCLRRVIGGFACAHLFDAHLQCLIRTFPPPLTTMTLNHRRLERFDTRL